MSLSIKCIFKNLVDQILGGAEDIIVGMAKADFKRMEDGFNELASGFEELPSAAIDTALFPVTYAIDELDELAHDVDDQLNEIKDKVGDEVDKGLKGIGHVVEETAGVAGGALGNMFSSFFGSFDITTWLLIGVGAYLLLSSDSERTVVTMPEGKEAGGIESIDEPDPSTIREVYDYDDTQKTPIPLSETQADVNPIGAGTVENLCDDETCRTSNQTLDASLGDGDIILAERKNILDALGGYNG